MKKGKSWVALLVLLTFILSCTLVGCGQKGALTDKEDDKNAEPVVISLAGGDWGFPDPFAHQPRKWGSFYTNFIFDSLLYEDESGIIPWLASDWEVQDAGSKYTFTLREDVKWQDGEAFTADDVVFTFNYFKEKNNTLYNIAAIKSVNKLNDYKVEFEMNEPMLLSINKVFEETNIIPKHIWEDVNDPKKYHTTNPKEAVIGTGPYILADYQQEHGIYRFIRNEEFWGGVPRVAEINTVPTSKPVLSLLNGEIAVAEITQQDLASIQDKTQFEIIKSPPYKTQWLCFNLENPILGDVNFRHAMAYAVDQQEVLDRICMGKGIVGSQGLVPETHPLYNPGVSKYPYDPEKAGQMLDELGYKDTNGDGIREDKSGNALKIQLLTTPKTVRSAELIKNQLSKVGLDLEVKSNETTVIDELTNSGQFQMILQFGGVLLLGEDPDYLRAYFVSQGERWLFSPYGYNNSRLAELGEKQRTEIDSEKRKAMLFEMQKILSDDIPNFYICGDSVYNAYNKEIYDGWFCAAGSPLPDISKLVYIRGKMPSK